MTSNKKYRASLATAQFEDDKFLQYVFSNFWKVFACIIIFVFLAWSTTLVWIVWSKDSQPGSVPYQTAGTFGDSFGIVNSLFSGLAFSVVAAALLLQRKDVNASLKEMNETTAVLRRQAEIAELSQLEDTRARNERLAEIYQRFASPRMVSARSSVWRDVKDLWFSNEDYRTALTYYNMNRVHMTTDQIAQAHSISDLVDFYSHIFRLLGDDKIALEAAANQYFYHWWRGFLISYVLCSRRAWENICVSERQREQMPFHQNLTLILELDLNATNGIPFEPESHVAYAKFGCRDEIYPSISLHNTRAGFKTIATPHVS